MIPEVELDAALGLLHFINASPSPYHAAANVAHRLERQGYTRLDEREPWSLEPGRRHYLRRGGTLVAFECGTRPPESTGFLLFGAHTDSPNLRVKPQPDLEAQGYRQLGVEVYGGVLLSTWLDRDLSIAGRVRLRGGHTELVDFEEPLCRISNLAIHLERTVNTEGLKLNPQKHLVPVLGLQDTLGTRLIDALAHKLTQDRSTTIDVGDILGFDLCLYDTQPGSFGGLQREFIHSARLDNLASCYSALCALEACKGPGPITRVVAFHDHEEVGSQSATGAKSQLLMSVLERIALSYPQAAMDARARALAQSLLISADMAHGVHPNYPDKHDAEHRPMLGSGPVLKINVNQSYATDAISRAVFEQACSDCGFSPQRFVSRNDSPCGSTLGPIVAARLGIRTLDVGNPMWSMHSCRESAGTRDVSRMTQVMMQLLHLEQLPDPAD